MTQIVLASKSPRRQALLRALGVEFEVVPSDADELEAGPAERLVVDNARLKRDDVASRLNGGAVVIAADTLVFLDDHVLSKPKDLDEARNMLARLSGRTHTVMTGLAVADTARGVQAQGCEQTQVTFRELSSSEIDRFVEAVNPVDRAGAYTVDGPGSLLVKRYEGCYHNVLGFPLVRLDVLLRDTGHSLFDWVHGPRSSFL